MNIIALIMGKYRLCITENHLAEHLSCPPTLQLRADGGDEGSEALAEALVHVNTRGRHHEQQLQHQAEGRLHVLAEHRPTGVSNQTQGVQGPHLVIDTGDHR